MYIASNTELCYNNTEVIIMAYSKAQSKAVVKYVAKAYDQISVKIPKGEREQVKAYAESKGMSLNGYIVDLIKKDMEKSQK